MRPLPYYLATAAALVAAMAIRMGWWHLYHIPGLAEVGIGLFLLLALAAAVLAPALLAVLFFYSIVTLLVTGYRAIRRTAIRSPVP